MTTPAALAPAVAPAVPLQGALDSTTTLVLVVMLGMAVLTVSIGVYLLRTNPPKDRSKFLGIGAEKIPDEELEEEMERRERDRDELG